MAKKIGNLVHTLFMSHADLIVRNPDILAGKPTILGTRISVELIVRKLASGYTIDTLLEAYPHLTQIQITAALNYAVDVIAGEEIIEHV